MNYRRLGTFYQCLGKLQPSLPLAVINDILGRLPVFVMAIFQHLARMGDLGKKHREPVESDLPLTLLLIWRF